MYHIYPPPLPPTPHASLDFPRTVLLSSSHTPTALRQGRTLNCGWSCMEPAWKRRGPWLVPPRDLPPNSAAPWAAPQGGVCGHRWRALGVQGAVPSCSPPQLWGKALHSTTALRCLSWLRVTLSCGEHREPTLHCCQDMADRQR